MNPRERITAAEALKRPYFTKIADKSSTAQGNSRRANPLLTANYIPGGTASPHLPFPDFKSSKD